MLTLHYVGPKPIINQHGVFFKPGKEDKYLYLKSAVYLLLALDRQSRKRSHHTPNEHLSDEQILDILKAYEPDLDRHIAQEEQRYEEHIEAMKNAARLAPVTGDERTAWLNNIEIMRPYLVQREINKLYYIHCIRAIKEIIHDEQLQEIDVDFSFKNWHILSSIAGSLEYGVKSVSTVIKVTKNPQGEMIARLVINPPSDRLVSP